MERFCKIIELEKEQVQVLVRKDYNTEEEKFTIQVQTDIEGMYLNTEFGYSDEKERDKQFEIYDQPKAENLIRSFKKEFM